MTKCILIDRTFTQSRVVLMDDSKPNEILIEQKDHKSLVGNVYLGVVVRVLPSVQAAFVDIGRERTAFLHERDLDKASPITTAVHAGQRIIVQVLKDEFADKGARLSTRISLSSRYLAYLPLAEHGVGVSGKITGKSKAILHKQLLDFGVSGRLIARSVATEADAETLAQQWTYLRQLWQDIHQQKLILTQHKHPKPTLIYQELSLPLLAVRDHACSHTQQIITDDQALHQELLAFAKQYTPSLLPKLTYHDDPTPMFEQYDLETTLHNALGSQVALPSGGHLWIEQTQAMTTIDVNTGSFVGASSAQRAYLTTNLEATHAIAHELRLRNIGGLIVLDFIDMDKKSHQTAIMDSLVQALTKDPATICIAPVSQFGLIEMTRERLRPSLSDQLCQTCPTCHGTGKVKSSQTISFEIIRKIIQLSNKYPTHQSLTVHAHPEVIAHLQSVEQVTIEQLQVLTCKTINLSSSQACPITHHQLSFGA